MRRWLAVSDGGSVQGLVETRVERPGVGQGMLSGEMDSAEHWDRIYRSKRPDELSWFQHEPQMSLALVRQAAPDPESPIIDIGGGASTLVDELVAADYRRISVLDLSLAGLSEARRRLGPAGAAVNWIHGDVLAADLPQSEFAVWHDRAVFHFLVSESDRARYVARARAALKPGGHLLIATFAHDGPTECSGLPVVRYTRESLHTELGEDFRVLDSVREVHVTPSGAQQAFVYLLCRFEATGSPAPRSWGVQSGCTSPARSKYGAR